MVRAVFSVVMIFYSLQSLASWTYIFVAPDDAAAAHQCRSFVSPEDLDYYARGSYPACNYYPDYGTWGYAACEVEGKFYSSSYYHWGASPCFLFVSAGYCVAPKLVVDGQCVDQRCPTPYEFSLASGSCEAHCTNGETWDPLAERCIPLPETQSCPTQGKEPIDFIRGRKYRTELVIQSGIRYPFSLSYFYNNQRNQEKTPTGSRIAVPSADRFLAATKPPRTAADYQISFNNRGVPTDSALHKPTQHYGSLDQYWRHSFDEVLQVHGSDFLYQNAKGHEIVFAGLGSSQAYPYLKLQTLAAGEETFAGYKLVNSTTREVKKFDSDGRLIKIERSPQDVLTLIYDAQYRLDRVTNSEGAFIQLVYQMLPTNSIYSVPATTHAYPTTFTNNRGEVAKITWGKTYQGKTAKFHLITQITEVTTGQAQSARTFEYNDTRWPASVTDQYFVADISSNQKQQTLHVNYDDLGRAIFSGLSGIRQSDAVTYVDDNTRVVTNALGKQATYTFANYNGVKRLQSVTGEPTQNCVSSEVEYQYFANGNVQRKIQNGQMTEYQYDNQNRETSRIEAVGTPAARTILTEYHPTLNLPVQITEPGKVTMMTYDASGRLLTQNIQSTTP